MLTFVFLNKPFFALELFISILFFAALGIQLVYILFVFTKLINHTDYGHEISGQEFPAVSIIIAASNELDNLKTLLPILDSQDYPKFEIVVSDDRSADGTYDYLLTNEGKYKNVVFLRILDLPKHYTAKKYAVTMAIKKSLNEILLFTDADCLPEGDQWIKQMVCQLTTDKEIVLGFSKYDALPGGLNALIRYETFQTAVQYLSFALAKTPYMGVGRNLLYKKSLFWRNNGFAKHQGLLSGDDDLFINQASNKNNVAICTALEGSTSSHPKETWAEWFVQKRRHLSVGKKYKLKDKLNLGMLWYGQMFSWLLLIPAFFLMPENFEAPEWSRIPNELLSQYKLAHWYPFNDWMRLVLGIFITWLLIKWLVLSSVNRKLQSTIQGWKIPYYDFLYTIYLLIFGIITLFSNPKKIKWK